MGYQSVKDLVLGVLIGFVSHLPGASGATIAVIFGIYERLVADIADIRGKLFRDLRFIVVIFIGFVIGMLICARGLKFLIEDYEIPLMFLFVALIVTQIPDIKRMGDDGTPLSRANVIALVAGMCIMLSFLFIGVGDGESSDPGFLLMFFAGIVYAVSKLAPGVSGSTVLLAMGLYTTFNNALADIDLHLLLPMLLGLIVGALAFAKVIEYFLTRSRKSTYYAILGLTVGSALTVLIDAARGLSGGDMVIQSVICIVIGAAAGLVLSRLARMYSASE